MSRMVGMLIIVFFLISSVFAQSSQWDPDGSNVPGNNHSVSKPQVFDGVLFVTVKKDTISDRDVLYLTLSEETTIQPYIYTSSTDSTVIIDISMKKSEFLKTSLIKIPQKEFIIYVKYQDSPDELAIFKATPSDKGWNLQTINSTGFAKVFKEKDKKKRRRG